MDNHKKLKIALLSNAGFSIFNGLVLLFFYKPIAELMFIEQANLLFYLGIGLLLFAGSIYWIASRRVLNKRLVTSIIIQDWLWIIGSVLILLFQLFGLSFLGYEIILIVALIVAIFAILQNRYLQRIEA